MKAAYINYVGPASNITYGDLPEPQLGSTDVLVRVSVVAVDPIDTYIRSGKYKMSLPFSFIIGRDMCGTVVKTGTDVRDFKEGDRVWSNNQGYDGRQGTFAELLSIDQRFLYHLPNGIDERSAVAAFHSAITAVTGLVNRAHVSEGDVVFINGGSGNVGTAVLQLAKKYGARVAVTAGSQDKVEWCREAGADLVINYKTQNVVEELRKFAPEGVNIYWDTTKQINLENAVNAVAERGRIVVMAGVDHKSMFPIGPFYTRNITMYGFTITNLSVDELQQGARVINECLSANVFKAKIHKALPLSKAAEAHAELEQGELFGKIILTCGGAS